MSYLYRSHQARFSLSVMSTATSECGTSVAHCCNTALASSHSGQFALVNSSTMGAGEDEDEDGSRGAA